MKTNNKSKRYYEIGETVYVRDMKRFATINSITIDRESNLYKAQVTFEDNQETSTLDLWEITKDRREQFKLQNQLNNPNYRGLNVTYQQVKEFHQAFNQPVAEKPSVLETERGLNRMIWTGEELVEFLHASSKNEEEFTNLYNKFLEGLNKAFFKSLACEYVQDETERMVAQADALTDTAYFVNGSFVEMGIKPQQLFEIVQNSNMSKLFTDENGKKFAKYRDGDGKVLKSPDFFPPEEKLKEEILYQLSK